MNHDSGVQAHWEASFADQIAQGAYNTAAVEALVRNVSYYLRKRYTRDEYGELHFLEMGCGAGSNLLWLAEKGIRVSGIDISPTAIDLARRRLEQAGLADRIGQLMLSSVSQVPFAAGSFSGIIEACVFQHLGREDRLRAFGNVNDLLKPGGLFAGYMLDVAHTVFERHRSSQAADDPGTLFLEDGDSRLHLTNLGLCHFYTREEIAGLLAGMTMVDPCLTTYDLPKEEARKRGYEVYRQSMWAVYAVK